jgi:hypothetical protein
MVVMDMTELGNRVKDLEGKNPDAEALDGDARDYFWTLLAERLTDSEIDALEFIKKLREESGLSDSEIEKKVGADQWQVLERVGQIREEVRELILPGRRE